MGVVLVFTRPRKPPVIELWQAYAQYVERVQQIWFDWWWGK